MKITSRHSCNSPVTLFTHKRLTVYRPVAYNTLKTEGETGSTFFVITLLLVTVYDIAIYLCNLLQGVPVYPTLQTHRTLLSW